MSGAFYFYYSSFAPLSDNKAGATVRLDGVFLKAKYFRLQFKKMRYCNLPGPGAMVALIEGILFIHNDKAYFDILAPSLMRKPYLNFAF
jgi:hypothetical protein